MYIDEQHRMRQELSALRQSFQPPAACSQGHLFRVKDLGVLECVRCMLIPYGIVREEDRP